MEKKTCSIFDKEAFENIVEGIQVSQLMKFKQGPSDISDDINQMFQELNVSDCLYCSFCKVSFSDQSQQRQHYKLDWHRYNLKQHLAHKKLVTEEKFSQIADNDDVSSISGSESDSETESSQTETEELSNKRVSHLLARQAKILLENKAGQMLAFFQCLLHDKKRDPPTEDQLVDLTKKLPSQNCWLIFMLGGGHMAAAVFKGTEAIRHKTFHSYTVRAKQGGSQSSKDNSGRHAKSSGASLRRYNELTLIQHVQEIMSLWAEEIAICQLIFYRAVGPFNRSTLFGGKSPPLNKADPRLRKIPFPTRRATFSEVQRVHSLLATVTVYGSAEEFRANLCSPRKPRKEDEVGSVGVLPQTPASPPPRKVIDRAKSRQSPDRALPDIVNTLAAQCSSESESDLERPLFHHNQEICFNSSLQEFEDTVPPEVKKKKKNKKEKPPEKELSNETRNFRRKVLTASEAGDKTLLLLSLSEEGSVISEADKTDALNQINTNGLTLLQNCAQKGHKDIIRILLENGANPIAKDKKAMTAYDFAPDKETRNVFRRFMGDYPDKYDYSKSHIPSALTDEVEQEQAEKRRQARKQKRLKEKEKRILDEPRRQEEAEKKRFLELSDREKRALAAERRLLAASGKAGVVLTRCYLCGADITGKVPFTYETFLFCSMPCLKGHRVQQKTQPS